MKIVREFLTKLSIGYKCRRTHITLCLTPENYKIVKLFYGKSCIKVYQIQSNQIQIKVWLRYIKNKPLFTNIEFISTSGHRKYITKEGLTYFKKNKGGNARILLNTSYGLLNSKISENLAIGGEISYILYE